MSTELLLIQHTATTTPGVALPWLKKTAGFQHVQLHSGQDLPAPKKNRSIILCGGGPHVDQEDQYPWLRPEKKFLEESFKLGNKVVGLCLGGQLCADVLGAKVYAHPKGWEIGWWDLHLKETQNLAGFEKNQTIKFSQHHRYVFEAPKDSQIIASNSWWEAQAFLWNNQVLAFQFHPERDHTWCTNDSDDKPCEVGMTQKKSEIVQLGTQYQPTAAKWFESVLDGFLK